MLLQNVGLYFISIAFFFGFFILQNCSWFEENDLMVLLRLIWHLQVHLASQVQLWVLMKGCCFTVRLKRHLIVALLRITCWTIVYRIMVGARLVMRQLICFILLSVMRLYCMIAFMLESVLCLYWRGCSPWNMKTCEKEFYRDKILLYDVSPNFLILLICHMTHICLVKIKSRIV